MRRERQTPIRIATQQKLHRYFPRQASLLSILFVSRHGCKSPRCSSTIYRRVSVFHLSPEVRVLLTRFCHAICSPWESQFHILFLINKEREFDFRINTLTLRSETEHYHKITNLLYPEDLQVNAKQTDKYGNDFNITSYSTYESEKKML